MKNTAVEQDALMVSRAPSGGTTLLRENLLRIEEQVAEACRAAGRARSEVAVMAVSKMHPVSAVVEAEALGIRLFGENRVQEFQEKRLELVRLGHAVEGETAARFHFIGHLQSNKAARAVELFSAIDSLDSLALAERLNEAAVRVARRMPVLIEVKLSPEVSKAGIEPDSAALGELLEHLPGLGGLELRGLMTVPPYLDDPAAVKPYFARLRCLRDKLASAHPRLCFDELSMGMSHDFPVAIVEGATQIRIGTALFGKRVYPK